MGVGDNTSFSAIISGDWKLISGGAGGYDGWWSNGDYTHETINSTSANVTVNGNTVFLFDLSKDPSERQNIALAFPDVVARLQNRLDQLAEPTTGYVDPQANSQGPRSLPAFHDG